MDLTLILDPPPHLSFGNLTDRDLLDLRGEIESWGFVDPVFTSIVRSVHVLSTQRRRGRDVTATLKLPKVAPELAKTCAEKGRHMIENMTGRADVQGFLCEVCLALLLERPARAGHGVHIEAVGYVARIRLLNELLDEGE